MDDATRAALKSYQKDNGLKITGTLNRETLEKMGIALTEKQMATPAAENKPEKESEAKSATESRSRGPIFRATKDQINAAQRLLKEKGMYSGDEIGKLDDATREGLKKFQSVNGLKVTGTLNAVTLEKMGIPLTDKQKADLAASTTNK
jgi:peptidoglycan hydrolase-like protein with peptidoglycan-binding domain